MVKSSRFEDFKPAYKKTISEQLYNIVNEIVELHPKLKPKWLVALYFSGAKPAELEAGIRFKLVQMSTVTQVKVNNMQVPVMDIYEGQLYKILFNGFTIDNYDWIIPSHLQLIKTIRYMKPFFNERISFDSEFGVHAIHQLRLYALIHDYHVPIEIAARICNRKLGIFGEIPMEKANSSLASYGIKLSPSFI
jgi:hypothetical protein